MKTTRSIRGRKGSRQIVTLLAQVSLYVFLGSISFVFLFPIIKMVSQAFMSTTDIIAPDVKWVPNNPSFDNLAVAIRVLDVPKSLFSSIWFVSLLAILQTSIAAITGFTFARYRFRFKKIIYSFIILSFILPVQLLVIPRMMFFISLQDLVGFKVIGTIIPQVMTSALGQGVSATILTLIFINFFSKIPKELYEAGNIDGATPLQLFWHITVKISISTVFVVFLFAFVWNWNETFITSIFLRGKVSLLTIKMSEFNNLFNSTTDGVNKLNQAYQAAGQLITTFPIIILYIFTQKQFVEGIESTGITGQ